MQGGVYSLRIQGHTANDPHPHVVVLEMHDQCLVIPCFDVNGHDINERIALAVRRGFDQEDVCVKLDNAIRVRWRSGTRGKISYWHVERLITVDSDFLTERTTVGQMDNEGLLAIVRGLLRFSGVQPQLFSKNRVRRLE